MKKIYLTIVLIIGMMITMQAQEKISSSINVGHEYGIGDFNEDRVTMDVVALYDLNDIFDIGIGTGFRYYYDSEYTVLPLYLEGRAYLYSNTNTPYIGLKVGYSIDITDAWKDFGFLITPSIGYRFEVINTRMVAGASYSWQEFNGYDMHAIGAFVGISF